MRVFTADVVKLAPDEDNSNSGFSARESSTAYLPTLEVAVIHALHTDGGTSIDPALKDLPQLTRDQPFVRYNVYKLLDDKLSDTLGDEQKRNFVMNLLQEMRRDKVVVVDGKGPGATWKLHKSATDGAD